MIRSDLARIAHDRVLIDALSAGRPRLALAEADRQLVRHVVRIRIVRGSRVLVDANPASFDVAGSGVALRDRRGRPLGRLEITVQDVVGFVKLVHKLNGADVAVVRGQRGQVRTSLPAAARVTLPRTGCVAVAGVTYVTRSFTAASFTGEPLVIWILVAR